MKFEANFNSVLARMMNSSQVHSGSQEIAQRFVIRELCWQVRTNKQMQSTFKKLTWKREKFYKACLIEVPVDYLYEIKKARVTVVTGEIVARQRKGQRTEHILFCLHQLCKGGLWCAWLESWQKPSCSFPPKESLQSLRWGYQLHGFLSLQFITDILVKCLS